MSIKSLKEGILNRDWDKVLSAYEAMTGDNLQQVEEIVPVVETVKKSRGRPKKTNTTTQKKQTIVNNNNSVKKQLIGTGINTFVDDGKEFASDKAWDKKINGNTQRAERREAFQPKKIQCSKCNKFKEINYPILNEESFVCDGCIIKGRK